MTSLIPAGEEQFRWTVKQTLDLIQFWAENEIKFTKKKYASKMLWEKAVKDLGLEGKVTGEKASKKWENLKKRYKDLRQSKSGFGTDGGETTISNWQYYEAMHAVLGGRPAIDPPVIVASFQQAEDPTALLLAMVTPDNPPEPEPADENHTPQTQTPSVPRPPTTTATPATPCPPMTPASGNRKRSSDATLAFLQSEAAKEQKRHEETEAKTDRFLILFERLVNKMPEP
ncbi:hypothetical protein ACEWY4_010215 [Coilia grayii]|uniref:Myb/SANT-like DNA-binding domain-containing protein n=1 Tax=Coilia grayii TaxID=363190 RepID=A0ABD1K8S2_9TELE